MHLFFLVLGLFGVSGANAVSTSIYVNQQKDTSQVEFPKCQKRDTLLTGYGDICSNLKSFSAAETALWCSKHGNEDGGGSHATPNGVCCACDAPEDWGVPHNQLGIGYFPGTAMNFPEEYGQYHDGFGVRIGYNVEFNACGHACDSIIECVSIAYTFGGSCKGGRYCKQCKLYKSTDFSANVLREGNGRSGWWSGFAKHSYNQGHTTALKPLHQHVAAHAPGGGCFEFGNFLSYPETGSWATYLNVNFEQCRKACYSVDNCESIVISINGHCRLMEQVDSTSKVTYDPNLACFHLPRAQHAVTSYHNHVCSNMDGTFFGRSSDQKETRVDICLAKSLVCSSGSFLLISEDQGGNNLFTSCLCCEENSITPATKEKYRSLGCEPSNNCFLSVYQTLSVHKNRRLGKSFFQDNVSSQKCGNTVSKIAHQNEKSKKSTSKTLLPGELEVLGMFARDRWKVFENGISKLYNMGGCHKKNPFQFWSAFAFQYGPMLAAEYFSGGTLGPASIYVSLPSIGVCLIPGPGKLFKKFGWDKTANALGSVPYILCCQDVNC